MDGDTERNKQDSDPLGTLPPSASFSDFNDYVTALQEEFRQETDPLNREGIRQALSIVGGAGELVALTESVRNPFNGVAFDPNGTVEALIKEGGARTFIANLPYAIGADGQKIRMRLAGASVDSFNIVSGSDTVTLDASGEFDLVVSEGQRSVAFSVLQRRDIDTDSDLTLSATLVDASGNPTHLTHLEANIHLDARDEITSTPATTRDIVGDQQPVDPPQEDDLGNPVTSGPAPNSADTLKESSGNDHIMSGGGNDRIGIGRGGGDWIEAGDGRDEVLPRELSVIFGDFVPTADGPGDDLVEGGAGADLLSGGDGNDRVYGDVRAETDVLITAGNTVAPTGLQGDFVSGGAGDDVVAGGAADDLLSGGGGEDVLIAGAGKDFVTGDIAYTAQSLNWTVTESAGGGGTVFTVNGATQDSAVAGADQIHAGAGDDVMLAGGGDDLVFGEAGNDRAWGEAGDDTLLGGEGNDILNGDNGTAVLAAALHGSDFLDGGDGDDQLFGMGASDALFGGAGNDSLVGDSDDANAGDDYLDGETGSDELVGAGGADTLLGGEGNDLLLGDSDDTGAAAQGSDELFGEAGNDQLRGYAGDDLLDGGADNDIAIGDEGQDTLLGGLGDDQLFGDSGANQAVGEADFIDGGDGADLLSGEGGDDMLIGAEGNDQLFGGTGDDVLDAGAGDDIAQGGEGDDAIDGGEGADTLRGDFGSDTLYGDAGIDTLFGGEGDDTLDGGEDGDTLQGEGGSDTLTGGAGNDTLNGGLDGSSDTLVGGSGDDNYFVDESFDIVFENPGEGNDTVTTSLGYTVGENIENFTLTGTADLNGTGDELANIITGNAGANVLTGLAGSDFLEGGAGNDTLVGNADSDILHGREGDDTLYGQDEIAVADAIAQGADGPASAVKGNFISGHAGADTLVGGDAADLIAGGAGIDTIVAGAGNDTIFPAGEYSAVNGNWTVVLGTLIQFFNITGFESSDLSGDIVHAGGGTDFVYGGWGPDQIEGEGGNDRVFGNRGNDLIGGGVGDDVLWGDNDLQFIALSQHGNDTIDGGDGSDLIIGGGGNDTLFGGDGGDSLWGELFFPIGDLPPSITGNDFLDGGAGNDQLHAQFGTDTLFGGEGDDIVDGMGDADVMHGGAGDDRIFVDNAGDVVIEHPDEGIDTVSSQIDYTLGANLENLELHFASRGIGNELDNIISANAFGAELFGMAGNDTLFGTGGNDMLDGGAGNDTLLNDGFQGAAGNDLYFFNPGFGQDTVLDNDATAGNQDIIRFGAGITPASVAASRSGLNLVLANGSDIVTVQNWFASDAQKVERVEFADTTVWDVATLNAMTSTGGNNAPTLANPIANQAATEDQAFSFTVPANSFADTDASDTLTHTASRSDGSALPTWLTFISGTRTFNGTPLNADVGTLSVQVTATDSHGASVFDVFDLSVANTNDVPTVANPIANQAATQDQAFSFTVPANSFADVDAGDTLIYTATRADGSALPAWLTFIEATRTFSGTPANANVGTESVRVTATDTQGASVFDVFDLTVASSAINGTAGDDTLNGTPGNDIINGLGGNDGIFAQAGDDTLDGGGGNDTLDGGAGADTLEGGSGDDTFIGGSGNDTYVLNVGFGHDLVVDNDATSGNVDTIVFGNGMTSEAVIVEQVGINDQDIRLSFIGGTDAVIMQGWLTSDDSKVERLEFADAVVWGVQNIMNRIFLHTQNHAPTLTSRLADQAATEDAAFSFTVPGDAFADVDVEDMLTFTATRADGSALPSWLTFNPATRTLSGTPVNADVGTVGLKVTATDGGGLSAFHTFDVTVANTNDAPTLATALADQSATEGTPFGYTLSTSSFVDADAGDILSFTATRADGLALPGWLAFDAATRTFSGMPATADVGTLQVRVTATDTANASATDVFQLTVTGDEDDHHDDRRKGNEGVGNGEDPPPPGHDHNQNDGPGIGPGNPGRRQQTDDRDSARRDESIGELVQAYLARKPDYDFEALAGELERSQRREEALNPLEIARRWRQMHRYIDALGEADNEEARYGALVARPGFFGQDAAGPGAGGIFGHAGARGSASGAADLRVLQGLEEGFARLRT